MLVVLLLTWELIHSVSARFDIQCRNDSQVYPHWISPAPCFQQQFHDIYIFGDSYSDNGQPLEKWEYYKNHNFSERYINGPTWAEYYAKMMGANLYDFAYSGATVDNSIVYRSTLDIHQQIESFHQKGGPSTSPDKTLYTFWIGTNDVNQAFTTVSNVFDREKIIESTVASLYTALEALYHMPSTSSVKHILVMGLAPIDHMPYISNMITDQSQRGPMTDLVARYNHGLKHSVVGRFQKDYPQARVYFYDANAFFHCVFSSTMFADVSHACFDQHTVCTNETRYFWWDDVHPTTAASYVMAKNMFASLKFN